MDLLQLESLVRPLSRAAIPVWREGMGVLGGGTWLFSEPQPGLRSLVDLGGLGWAALEVSEAGLRIGATCTIAALEAFEGPAAWVAGPLFAGCCQALLGSFKVWNTATVGGNVCLALPAAPMLALTVALEGVAEIWVPDGGVRFVPMEGFALGERATVLGAGEILRSIHIGVAALRRRAAWRQASLTALGRSAALLVATRDAAGGFSLTITASTVRPVYRAWAGVPDAAAVDGFIEGLAGSLWHDDVHGAPVWRRHMTRRLAAELLLELR